MNWFRKIPNIFQFSNLTQLLAYLYLFLLPTQLGKHFFFDFSYFVGVRSAFLALVIYGTDIIFLTLIAIFIFNRRKNIFIRKIKISKIWWVVAAFLVMNFFASSSRIEWGYRFLRILEVVGLVWIFMRIKLERKKVVWILIVSTLIQLFLVVYQIDTGRSLQGIAWWLGERMFDGSYPGIAKVYLWGIEKVRGYGSFSHPNSMGGFFLLWFVYFFTATVKRTKSEWVLMAFCGGLILLSFSKVAILTMFLILTGQLLLKNTDCIICKLAKVTTFLAVTLIFFLAIHDEQGIEKRIFWSLQAIELIRSHPIFGVGIGNYLLAAASLNWRVPFVETHLQPVHNIFLLLLAEMGLVGTGLFSLAIRNLYQISPHRKRFLVILLAIGFLGMWDHYLLTLHQNLALSGVLCGLLLNTHRFTDRA